KSDRRCRSPSTVPSKSPCAPNLHPSRLCGGTPSVSAGDGKHSTRSVERRFPANGNVAVPSLSTAFACRLGQHGPGAAASETGSIDSPAPADEQGWSEGLRG